MRFLLAIVSIVLVWGMPASALAVGQGETSLSGGLGLALAFQSQTRAGVQADVRLLRGISDSWAARLGVQTAWYPSDGAAPSAHVTAQSVGLTWAADVLNLVPFADIGIAVADLRGAGLTTSWRLGGQLGLGADYLLTRHLSVSLLARVEYFPLRLVGGHDAHPTQTSLGLYLGRVF
jgi:hypothetical protein